MKHTIAIVDDHVLIANALKEIISKFQNFEVIYLCENGLDLQKKLPTKQPPTIVLLDVSMPVMDGFETAKWLKENHPSIQIMALSMQDNEQSLIAMIKNGAKGYMLKNTQPTLLEKGLEALVKKGHYFPDWASSKILTSVGKEKPLESLQIKLTDREIEFLNHSTSEMTYKQIAEKMFCSPRTVENYRDSLFEKLEIKSRVGLAVYALKNGYAQ